MDVEELKQFLQENNLKIEMVKAQDNDKLVIYTLKGYRGDKILFQLNIDQPVIDVKQITIWNLIEHCKNSTWIYSIFLEHEGIKPLGRYTEGLRRFIKALNLYGPPVIWINHGGALLHIVTDNYNTEHGFSFFLAGQKVAQISRQAIITPCLLGRPVNLFTECKACFSISDAQDFICEIYWPR